MRLLLLLMAFGATKPLYAQRLDDARKAYEQSSGSSYVRRYAIADSSRRPAPREVRFFTGLLGFAAGTLIGYHIADKSLGPCMCDDPGLDAAIWGITIGGGAGAALGVAALRAGSSCGFGDRLARAIGGATLGTFVGIGLGIATEGYGFLALPLTDTVGAMLAEGRC